MKINEFTNLDEEILDEYSNMDIGIRKELLKKGYKFLGKGVDQHAYLEPGTGYVLKVFGTRKNTKESGGLVISEDQKMFLNWVNYCNANKNNIFLPKFFGFEKFVFNNHTYFQIRQERLTGSGVLGDHLYDLSDCIAESSGFRKSKIIKEFKNYYPKAYAYLIKKLGTNEFNNIFITIYQLNLLGKRYNYRWDLHDDNFMKRGNTPVIVDPWVV